jgi:hypothetical protein
MMMDKQGDESVSYTLLTLHLVLFSDLPRPTGAVVLVNTGSAGVSVWQTGNRWGDTVLSFEVLHNGCVWRIVRREQVYTINVPSSFVLPAGSRHEWTFDLGDGDWEAETPIDQLTVPNAQLVAVFDVPPSPEAVDYGVWTGQLRSQTVLLGENMVTKTGDGACKCSNVQNIKNSL